MGLHGSIGEDGKLQATFDVLGIRYTGPGPLGCAVSMNKLVAKQIFKMSGVSTPRGTSLTRATKDTPLSELGYYLPLVIKPCSGGSSIGVFIVHTEEEYKDAIRQSFDINHEEEIVIEPYIKGREFACGIIAGKALPLVEIIPKSGFFNYENNTRTVERRKSVPRYPSTPKPRNRFSVWEKRLSRRCVWMSIPGPTLSWTTKTEASTAWK